MVGAETETGTGMGPGAKSRDRGIPLLDCALERLVPTLRHARRFLFLGFLVWVVTFVVLGRLIDQQRQTTSRVERAVCAAVQYARHVEDRPANREAQLSLLAENMARTGIRCGRPPR